MTKTDFILGIITSLIASILYELGLKTYIRFHKVPLRQLARQSLRKIYEAELFSRDQLILLNLNTRPRRRINIWVEQENIKRFMEAFPFSEFIKKIDISLLLKKKQDPKTIQFTCLMGYALCYFLLRPKELRRI